MKLLMVFSGLAFAFLTSPIVNAQAGTPVSCTWTTVTYNSSGSGFSMSEVCKNGSTVIGTRYRSQGSNTPYTCTVYASPGYYYAGTCDSVSFFKS